MIRCAKCNINWAKLWRDDDSLEFCPECGTDMHLEDVQDFVGYIKCPITGKITNAISGQALSKEEADARAMEKPKFRVVVGKPEKETAEEREARELAGIEAYLESGNPNDYHLTIKKFK